MNDILIIKIRGLMKPDNMENFRKRIISQKEDGGVIILPGWCDVLLAPGNVDIKIDGDIKEGEKSKKMKVPNINWIKFDRSNPPSNLGIDVEYLILLRTDNYDNGATWTYHMDYATPFGDYIDDFWDTSNDWYEGQRVEVVAYAEFPGELDESDLVEV